MASHTSTRGQTLFVTEQRPEQGTVFFEGSAYENFAERLDTQLALLVKRWAHFAAPAASSRNAPSGERPAA